MHRHMVFHENKNPDFFEDVSCFERGGCITSFALNAAGKEDNESAINGAAVDEPEYEYEWLLSIFWACIESIYDFISGRFGVAIW